MEPNIGTDEIKHDDKDDKKCWQKRRLQAGTGIPTLRRIQNCNYNN